MTKPLRDRRLLWPVKAEKPGNLFEFPLDYGLRNRCLDWIDTHTAGQFYIGSNVLYFCEDKDATAFVISDVMNKIKAWETLKDKTCI